MGSRLRENPSKLFQVFVEVAKPETGKEAFILQRYPPEYDDEKVLKDVSKFVYPCEMDCVKVDHFTFVMTDLEGMFRFGFCRHATEAQTCLCVVSFLPWFEVYYKLLNMLAEVINRNENSDLTPLLESMYTHEVPIPGVPVTIVAQQEMFSFTSPDPNELPSIPASRNLTEYYNAVDTYNMMRIFASMLNERRIVFTSKKLSRVTACVHAAESLLYPMHWQHLYIPLLPAHLIEYLGAPMPYIIGVHSALMQKVKNMELGDAVIVDTDDNTVLTEFEDLEDLPDDVSTYLKKNLKNDKVKSSMLSSGDAISQAFLNALVRLIGGYRDALKFKQGEPITFEPDAFVLTRTTSMQSFLQNMLHQQIFQQFINGRLDMLNCGQGFSDRFEKLAVVHADKLNTQSRYKEWRDNMKRQGKKLQKSGKDVWADLKDKAPIMMTSAVQTVKNQGKRAYSGLRTRFTEINENSKATKTNSMKVGNAGQHRSLDRQRPATIVGTELKGSRPPRPPPPQYRNRTFANLRATDKPRQYMPIDIIEEEKGSCDDSNIEYQRISINLMSDPDIQSAMHRSASANNLPHKLSNDDSESSSSSLLSSGAQTPAEPESSSIPYENFSSHASTSENIPKQQSKSEAGQISVLMDTVDSTTTSASVPVPPPRRQTVNKQSKIPPPRSHKRTTQEKQLIRFESSESEEVESEQFDPLSAVQRRIHTDKYIIDGTKSSPVSQRSEENQVSLVNRSPAFRRPNQERPKRSTYRPDSPPKSSNAEQDPSIFFDPLAGFDKKNYQNSPMVTTDKVNDSGSGSLLQDWTIDQLTGSGQGSVQAQPQPNAPVATNLLYNSLSASVRPASQAQYPKPLPKARYSTGDKYIINPSYQAPGQSNPLYVPPTQGSSLNQKQTNDPFSDLVNLQIGPQVTKPNSEHASTAPPKKSWETFD